MQFGSDNQAGASPKILEMLTEANSGFTHGYGNDQWCTRAAEALKKFFACPLTVFFVSTGTAANSLALSCLVQPWETILCHHQSHILQDESTAPEFFTGGARLVPITCQAGRLTLRHLEQYLTTLTEEPPHTPASGALSITQTNEAGQIYSAAEISELCACAHDHGLRTHMDGARFANAACALNCHPADITWRAGVDVLSLGATKCGALAAEAVVFFNRELAETFAQRRKRTGHLVSKGRLFGAQFIGWLHDDHWLELAAHANNQAERLADQLAQFPAITFQWPRQANELFITLPTSLADTLRAAGAEFYEWPSHALPPEADLSDEETFVRLVTSFRTTDQHLADFCKIIRDNLG